LPYFLSLPILIINSLKYQRKLAKKKVDAAYAESTSAWFKFKST